MIELRYRGTGEVIGEITEAQLQFLVDQMEEEDTGDQDYYVDEATIEFMEGNGGDPKLMAMLRKALGKRDGIEIQWVRS